MPENTSARRWSSGRTFLLASVGGAIGLGNIWRFPYIMGENGGGAFVFVYLVAAFLVAVPILSVEVAIGRHGRASPYTAMAAVSTQSGRWAAWGLVGGMGLLTGYLIMSFYSVIAGSTVDYLFLAAQGAFKGLTKQSAEALNAGLNDNPLRLGAWHTLFMAASCLIVGRNVRRGIEAAVRLLMPLLFLLLLAVIAYALIEGDCRSRPELHVRLPLRPAHRRLRAGGHQPRFLLDRRGDGADDDVRGLRAPRGVAAADLRGITVADTGVAVLAGMAIFPLVFANGLEPGSGPSLGVPHPADRLRRHAGRDPVRGDLLPAAGVRGADLGHRADGSGGHADSGAPGTGPLGGPTLSVGATLWGLGWLTVLSFGSGAEWNVVAGKNPFELIDYLTATIMMPLGGALMALFAGWRMKRALLLGELGWEPGTLFTVWLWLLRVSPPPPS